MHDGRRACPGPHTAAVAPPPPDALPRLRPGTPVLRRGPDAVQVGLEPGRAVVLHGAGPRALLRHLDGTTPRSRLDVTAAAAGLDRYEVEEVLHVLAAAGLLETGAGSVHDRAVRLVGSGQLGQRLAELLLEAGVDLHLADAADASAVADGGPLPRSSAGRLRTVDHWSKPDGRLLPLTAVAVDTVEVDRVLTTHLLRTDQPHLVLRSSGSGVTVGPLVLPGRTACLRCTDLTRRDTDPAWPVLLEQLVRLHRPASPVAAAWGAAVAAAQVLAHLAGVVPESAGATLDLDGADHLMRWRPWPRHAACGCAWSGTTEWLP
ncbi:ThiF family adenylyltransferase [Microlunatus lacustris]